MLKLNARNLRGSTYNHTRRNSVSIVEGDLKMNQCSPFCKDRYLHNENMTPTKSPNSRPPPLPIGKKESPYKSPISTPKKEKRYDYQEEALDAPDIVDCAPNRIVAVNSHGVVALAHGEEIHIRRGPEEVEYFMEATAIVDTIAWMGEDDLIISIQGEVEIWNTKIRSKERTLKRHNGRVTCITTKGNFVTTAGTDMLIHTTDLSTNKITTYSGHHHEVLCAAWSPDGAYLASCDASGMLIIWGNDKKKKVKLDYPLSAVAWVSQAIIAVGGSDKDGTLKYYNIICPEEGTKTAFTGSPISSLQWCSKHGLLVAHRLSPYEWEIYGRDMRCIASFSGHSGDILFITASPNEEYIATVGLDEKAVLWKINDRRRLKMRSASMRIPFPVLR